MCHIAVVRSQFDEKMIKNCKWILVRGMVLHVKKNQMGLASNFVDIELIWF